MCETLKRIPLILSRTLPYHMISLRKQSTSGILENAFSNGFLFRQLFDNSSSTYTYILADKLSKESIIIDPVLEQVDRDIRLITELGLKLKYAVNTHVHADHITGSGRIKHMVGNVESVISKESGATADILVQHGDRISFGDQTLEVRNKLVSETYHDLLTITFTVLKLSHFRDLLGR